jgi:Cu/Ag efflux pump CusA
LTNDRRCFVAQLGIIALFGMIMRNSVILVDQIRQDIEAGHDPWTAIRESAVRRFRPIMLYAAWHRVRRPGTLESPSPMPDTTPASAATTA